MLIGLIVVSIVAAAALAGAVMFRTQRDAIARERDQVKADRKELEMLNEAHLAKLEQRQKESTEAQSLIARLQEREQALRESFDVAQQQSRETFKALAGDTLKANSEQFFTQANEKLKPIADLLRRYDEAYKKIEESRKQEYGGLKQVTESLSGQTATLVTALRRPEVRGRWGEIALRRIIELAGLNDKSDFVEQSTVSTADATYRPDLIVRLPNERSIIVDAKMVFDAFYEGIALPEGEVRTAKMRQHAQQVRDQVQRLSSKAYLSAVGRSPDFLVLFLPIESALYAAMETDNALLEDAMASKVVIATPTILIALLKAVEIGWREQQVAANAQEIRELGQLLHERLTKTIGDIVKVGSSLEATVKNYNTLVGSIDSRLMPTARKFEQQGTRSAKELPASLDPVVELPREVRSVTSPDHE